MRAAPSVYTFLEEVGSKMKIFIKNKLTTPFEVAQAFEQSPLYQAYLDDGLKIMGGEKPAALSHHEIEAIADFRASLKRILGEPS